jgi:GTP-binding protein
LLNALRRDLGFVPVPIRLEFRGRSNPFDRNRR